MLVIGVEVVSGVVGEEGKEVRRVLLSPSCNSTSTYTFNSNIPSHLEVVLTAMFNNLFHQQGPELKQIEVFINAANLTTDSMSFEDFQKWCALLPAVSKYLSSLLVPSDSGSHVPKLLIPDNIDPGQILLQKEYAWHIAGALSDLEEWKLLYHSGLHGLSFNTFLGNMIKAPTLLVMRDREGYVYGGYIYVSQAWEKHSDFYGNMRCFLFQLYPKALIFWPTGANHNLQWRSVGFSSTSKSFWVVSIRVRPSNPLLSESKACRIYPETIECCPKADEDRAEALKGAVQEDRYMLNMIGQTNKSLQHNPLRCFLMILSNV